MRDVLFNLYFTRKIQLRLKILNPDQDWQQKTQRLQNLNEETLPENQEKPLQRVIVVF